MDAIVILCKTRMITARVSGSLPHATGIRRYPKLVRFASPTLGTSLVPLTWVDAKQDMIEGPFISEPHMFLR